MSEYAVVAEVVAGQSVVLPTPQGGRISGVYSSGGDMSLEWIYNGEPIPLIDSIAIWEPIGGFNPMPVSNLRITNNGDVPIRVCMRCSND